jgi:ubiquinone biosynthesis protein UbiJ
MSPEDFAASLANRTLAREDWARAKLAACAGRSFALTAGPFAATFTIGDDGSLAAAPSGAAPSLTVTTSPLSLPALAADPTRWGELTRNDGDPALAATIEELAQTFPWVVERALASVFGPIAGQALADVGRTLLGVPAALSKHAASSLGQFATETGVVARRADFDALSCGTAEAEARVDALAARIAAIESPGRPHRRPKKVT